MPEHERPSNVPPRRAAGGQAAGAEPLKTATAAVGLLTGVVAAVYVLGGLVIALRLLFDGFELSSVAAIAGQLPRELVVATALLGVGLPAVSFGLMAAMVAALAAVLRLKPADGPTGYGAAAALVILTIALVAPALIQAHSTDGFSPTLLTSVPAIAFAGAVVFACWREVKRVANRAWPPPLRVAVISALAAAVAVTPATMFAAALDFEEAQVCYEPGQPPQKGLLIGEAGDRVLLETNFKDEESVVSLPAGETSKTEYGDLFSKFTCPAPAAPEPASFGAGDAKEDDVTEKALARRFRPLLLFDSGEPWRPLEVSSFLAERFDDGKGHGACATGAEPPCPPPAGLDALGRGRDGPSYLDIHGQLRNGADYDSADPSCHEPPAVVDCNDGPGSIVYYRRTARDGRWYWDYWWLLRYNDYTGRVNRCVFVCGDHEGDWEGITVITTPAPEPRIVGAIYASHKDRVEVEGPLLPLAGTHPLVYVAKGTHAAYPFPCGSSCRQYSTRAGVQLPEESHDGVAAWGGNVDASCEAVDCVRPLPGASDAVAAKGLPRAAGWADWPGMWGETCHHGCKGGHESSPRSPGRQGRFQCPWVATRRAGVNGVLSKSARTSDAQRLSVACAAERVGL